MRRAWLLLQIASSAARAETIYISNEASGLVHRIDGATLKPLPPIQIGKRPRGMVISPDGHRLYVAVSDENHIAIIDLPSGRITGILPSGPDPETFASSHDGKRLYVANEDDNLLSIVDIEQRKIVGEVTVGGEPEGTAVSPDNKLVVQASETTSMAHVIDPASMRVTDNLLVDTRPRYVAFTPDDRQFWVSSEARGTLTIFDTASRKLIAKIDFSSMAFAEKDNPEVFTQPVGIIFTRDGKRAFVALGRGKLVAEIDPTSHDIVRTYPVGWRAWNLTLSPDERCLYTANGLSGDMTAIDIVANKPLGTIKLGGKPWGIRAAP